MSPLYPVLLDLARARVLVVGGGTVALRKVRVLVEHASNPVILAPELTAALAELVDGRRLEHWARIYHGGEAAGFQLVIAATDDAGVNAAVAEDATSGGSWVNVADDPAASTFHLPAVIRQGDVTVALSTGGASPLLARRLRERLETVVTPGVGRAAARLGALRDRVRTRWPEDESRRRAFWFALVSHELLDSAIAGRDDEVEFQIEQCLSQS